MFKYALTGLKSQINARETRIFCFQYIHDTQGLQIMLEAAEIFHTVIELVLAGMPKGGMPQIMGQSNGLAEILVQTQGASNRAGDLRNLDGVCQASTKQISFMINKHLGFVFKASKSGGMDDAIPVALEFTAIGRSFFLILTAERIMIMRGITRQPRIHGCLLVRVLFIDLLHE